MTKTEIFFETIKAVAVVIGVGFAVYEFVLKDRERDRARAVFTQELIQFDLSDSISESTQWLEKNGERLMAEMQQGDIEAARELERELNPQFQLFKAWGTCIALDICDAEVGKAYICQRAISFYTLKTAIMQLRGHSLDALNKQFKDLVATCEAEGRQA